MSEASKVSDSSAHPKAPTTSKVPTTSKESVTAQSVQQGPPAAANTDNAVVAHKTSSKRVITGLPQESQSVDEQAAKPVMSKSPTLNSYLFGDSDGGGSGGEGGDGDLSSLISKVHQLEQAPL